MAAIHDLTPVPDQTKAVPAQTKEKFPGTKP
jgi:hypothetical protein